MRFVTPTSPPTSNTRCNETRAATLTGEARTRTRYTAFNQIHRAICRLYPIHLSLRYLQLPRSSLKLSLFTTLRPCSFFSMVTTNHEKKRHEWLNCLALFSFYFFRSLSRFFFLFDRQALTRTRFDVMNTRWGLDLNNKQILLFERDNVRYYIVFRLTFANTLFFLNYYY